MTFSVDFVGFAEAAAMDYRGNISIGGFSPQYIAIPKFPVQVAPFFLVIGEDEGLGIVDGEEPSPEKTALFRIEIEDEDGNNLFNTQQLAEPQMKPQADMPGRIQILAQIPIVASKPGRFLYKISVKRISDSAVILEASKWLRIISTESE